MPGCGDPEGELLLQQGITSLEDLAAFEGDLLTSLPGIDEAGAQSIKEKAAELAVRKKAEEEEAERLEAERVEAEQVAAAAAAAEAKAAEAAAAVEVETEPVETTEGEETTG
ncbi:MAG: helix-hairpin-helix domain-containing protein [Deltaproteobacteria bacterium]|nr:helix-hairpin-helix domain-containing protein [Deltaproteobacteria bacterium]